MSVAVITADDPALMIDTSGTTGRSKGALLTHHNLVSNIVTLLQCWQWTAADRFLLALPMFHIHGLGNGLHGALASGCTTFLLPRGDIDAVILALHPKHSIDIAIEFLRNNKGVLDEKPLAVTLEDGRRLADVVAQSSSPYQIGFVFRYCETVRRIAKFADRIGSPAIYSVGVFDELLDRENTEHYNRMQQILRESSAVNHEGSHVFDFRRLWNDAEVVDVHATAVQTRTEFDGPNLWSVQQQLADGSALRLQIGWLLPAIPSSTVQIEGPGGTLYVALSNGRGIFDAGDGPKQVEMTPMAQAWDRQLDAFAHALDTGEVTGATIENGLAALTEAQACAVAARRT